MSCPDTTSSGAKLAHGLISLKRSALRCDPDGSGRDWNFDLSVQNATCGASHSVVMRGVTLREVLSAVDRASNALRTHLAEGRKRGWIYSYSARRGRVSSGGPRGPACMDCMGRDADATGRYAIMLGCGHVFHAMCVNARASCGFCGTGDGSMILSETGEGASELSRREAERSAMGADADAQEE